MEQEIYPFYKIALMAELADALDSGNATSVKINLAEVLL